jgi:hypothetical protein
MLQCDEFNTYGLWGFVVLAVLSHARGTVLLMREARLWFRRRNGRAARARDRCK